MNKKPLKISAMIWILVLSSLLGAALIYAINQLERNLPVAGGAPEAATAAMTPPPLAAPAGAAGAAAGPALLAKLDKLAHGEVAAFQVARAPKPMPEISFVDESGARVKLSDFRGKTLLLNVWATWCPPCRHEMPMFDALEGDWGPKENFQVVTIATDRGGVAKPRRFFNKIKVKNLKLYHDASREAQVKLRAVGLPLTILIDANGNELGRLAGPADWSSKDAKALIGAAL